MIYAAGQGDILDPKHDDSKIDWKKVMETIPCQDLGTMATFLRFKEAQEKFNIDYIDCPNTWLKHIPGHPEGASDKNYVVFQEWVPNLKEFKQFAERDRKQLLKAMPQETLKDLYHLTVYAALWNHVGDNLSIDTSSSADKPRYCFVNIRPPYNHRTQDFYFLGEEGEKKYADDVVKGLKRFIGRLPDPDQRAYVFKLAKEDEPLVTLVKKHKIPIN